MRKFIVLSVGAISFAACKNREFNSEISSTNGDNSEGVAKFRCKSEEPFNELYINSKEVILKGSSFETMTFESVPPQKASLRSFDKMRVYNVSNLKKFLQNFHFKERLSFCSGDDGL